IVSVTGSGASYTVAVTSGTGDGTIRLDVADDDTSVDASANRPGGAGTGNGTFTAGEVYSIDKTAPAVTSIVRADASPTNSGSIHFTVTFSYPVVGVDGRDLALLPCAALFGSIVSVTGSGASYTVAVVSGTGDGTIRLDVVD